MKVIIDGIQIQNIMTHISGRTDSLLKDLIPAGMTEKDLVGLPIKNESGEEIGTIQSANNGFWFGEVVDLPNHHETVSVEINTNSGGTINESDCTKK